MKNDHLLVAPKKKKKKDYLLFSENGDLCSIQLIKIQEKIPILF